MTHRRTWLAQGAAGILLAAFLASCGDAAPQAPENGLVADYADIIPADAEAALDSKLRKLLADTGNTLVVVSVLSLDGREIEPFATELFNRWGIGGAESDRGLLILIAPEQRRVRIEVGCGLESIVTNEEAAAIIQNDMLPLFRAHDLPGGTIAGADALIAEVGQIREPGERISPLCKADLKEAA